MRGLIATEGVTDHLVALDAEAPHQLRCTCICVLQRLALELAATQIGPHLCVEATETWADEHPCGDARVILPDGHHLGRVVELVAVEEAMRDVPGVHVPASFGGGYGG